MLNKIDQINTLYSQVEDLRNKFFELDIDDILPTMNVALIVLEREKEKLLQAYMKEKSYSDGIRNAIDDMGGIV